MYMSRTYKSESYKYSSIEDEEWKMRKDGKAWFRPSKKFKKIQKQRRKAKEKQALLKDPDLIPEFPKEDVYNWN